MSDDQQGPPSPDALSPDGDGGRAVDRSISPIAGRLGGDRRGKVIMAMGLIGACTLLVVANWAPASPQPQKAPDEPARQVVPFVAVKTPPAAPSPSTDPFVEPAPYEGAVPAIDPRAPSASPPGASSRRVAATTVEAVRSAPLLVYSRGGDAQRDLGTPPPDGRQSPRAANATELDKLREVSDVGLATARRLGDRNFLILAGTTLPCTLQTAMDTSTPGYVSCLLSRDVYSESGGVVLLERGTKVLGEYRSGMRQGPRRLFVLWTRAVTPGGVAIGLASPASDTLGRAGFDGEIDTHFWDRFGGALLLSIVDDATYAARNDVASQSVRVPSDAAAVALNSTVEIPPTLRKAQGAEVTIFAAQDFDFSRVYGVKDR